MKKLKYFIKNYQSQKGITLSTLVITIIVLLILAGVVLNLTFGENGIINKAKFATDKYKQLEENEIKMLSELNMNFTSDNTNSGSSSDSLEEIEELKQKIDDLQNQINNMNINSSNVIADRGERGILGAWDSVAGVANTGYTNIAIEPLIYFNGLKIYYIDMNIRLTGVGAYSAQKNINKNIYDFKYPRVVALNGAPLTHDSKTYRDGYISSVCTISNNVLSVYGYSNNSTITQFPFTGLIIDKID